jgi:gas vesicle protein
VGLPKGRTLVDDLDIRMKTGDVMSGRKWQATASGVLIGIGVGVAVGILLAPKSGKDTRDQIVGGVKEGLEAAVAKGQNLTRRVQQTLDDAKERLKDAADAGEQAYRDAKAIAS